MRTFVPTAVFSMLISPLSFGAHVFTDQATTVITSDGLNLTARLMTPAGAVRGAVVILPGNGGTPSVRYDGDVSSPFIGTPYRGGRGDLSNQIAEELAKIGIASLRYSKRGSEDLTQAINQTVPFLVNDAADAYDQLAKRFPQLKVGVVGLSEGALLAIILAGMRPVANLFLMALPSRPIDEALTYQWIEWPVSIMRRLDLNRDGELSASELSNVDALPLAGIPWKQIDLNNDGKLSIEAEVVPAYKGVFTQVMQMATTNAVLAAWYQSMKAVEPVSKLAAKVKAPLFFYQATEDSQVNPSWVDEDRKFFSTVKGVRFFGGLGHCFSPLDGAFGQVKTSGPIGDDVLKTLAADVNVSF